jgi:stalled ribosome rescue protein Dom34
VVVGRHALTLLPEGVAARAAWAAGLRAPLAEAVLVRTARRAAEEVRDTQHRRWLEAIREGAHPAGHGATGGAVVRQALALGAVERLLLSTALTQRDPAGAEAMARDALLQGAAVVVSPNGAGDQLERLAQGAAARLRYPLPAVGVPLPSFTPRAAASAPPVPLSSTPQLPLAGGPA